MNKIQKLIQNKCIIKNLSAAQPFFCLQKILKHFGNECEKILELKYKINLQEEKKSIFHWKENIGLDACLNFLHAYSWCVSWMQKSSESKFESLTRVAKNYWYNFDHKRRSII